MKRSKFEKYLRQNNCFLAREGGKHSIFENEKNEKHASVPRHDELKNYTVIEICQKLEIPKPPKF